MMHFGEEFLVREETPVVAAFPVWVNGQYWGEWHWSIDELGDYMG